MSKETGVMLGNGASQDETDRMPENITVTYIDLLMYVVAIVGHLVDLGIDANVAIRYYLAHKLVEFGWTILFILLPAFVNTAVSIRMYSQDKEQQSITNEFTRRRWLRIFILVLQMAPILHFTDALIYALKSRRAEKKRDKAAQRTYYWLMLKEDSDAALLRVFECFLEAAPQQVLQTSLLFFADEKLTFHQMLSISSSMIGMGWCLAAYQRAIRFTQEDKYNMRWSGTMLQTLWHFLVSLSRIISISIVVYLFPHWAVLACLVHILVMTTWIQCLEKSPFCTQNPLGQISFSFALGAVYLFTYILPVEGRTRYRYSVYYTICFLQNIACSVIWYMFVEDDMRASFFFYPVLVLAVVPYLVGLGFMILYYLFFYPKVTRRVVDIPMTNKNNDRIESI